MSLRETLAAISYRSKMSGKKSMPVQTDYVTLLERAITVLQHESSLVRPHDSSGLPGGLVYLNPTIPTLILPDLHARVDFFLATMEHVLEDGRTVLDSMLSGDIQVLCVGDGFHSERRGKQRWLDAFKEYTHGFTKHKAMDAEMNESLSLMEMVMECKRAARNNFHFLKGNHENILNEEGNGNHPFGKFAHEGEMVKEYIQMFYGEEFLQTYALFEKSLPLFVIGGRFLASHAEPRSVYSATDLIETRNRADVILGLTWTDNGEAGEGSVLTMLETFLPDVLSPVYFGGHRPVNGQYNLRAEGAYIQIHNPEAQSVALVPYDRIFDPETDFITI